ncbi:MAG TPA: Obg family GTPase CgtA, partial [Candidatus Limnocylindrales bacterium]|nr:Obg family GTPase CgtA [Candidatus Limnocylindrales bacterium]
DGSARDPEWDYGVIREELSAHDPALLAKPAIVAFNKLDLAAAAEAWPAFRAARLRDGIAVVAIAAAEGLGISDLVGALAERLPGEAELAAPPEPAGVVVHRIEPADEAVAISRDADGAYRVRSRRVERLADRIDFSIEESVARFQRDLERLGVEAELRRAGVRDGDLVRIGDHELEWASAPWEAAR